MTTASLIDTGALPGGGIIVQSVASITGTSGDDQLFVFQGRPSAFDPAASYLGYSLYGYAGNDTLYGGYGNDSLYGGDGSDSFYGNYGNDLIDGGAGIDTVNYSSLIRAPSGHGGGYGGGYGGGNLWHNGYGVVVNLAFGTASTLDPSSAEHDTLISIENVLGSSYGDVIQGSEENNTLSGLGGDDWLFGWGGNDFLQGGIGNDHISGGDGFDTLQGGLGNDYLIGNAGYDTADYSYTTNAMLISLADNYAYSLDGSGADIDSLFEIEAVTGTSAGDFILGDANANTLNGMDGNDVLQGVGGDDSLFGMSGDDRFIGGAGRDYMNGGDGYDMADYTSATGSVNIDLMSGNGHLAEAEGDYLSLIENVIGSTYSDALNGNNVVNELYGLAGNDNIFGNGGNDWLMGGVGADALNGGAGFDTASYADSQSAVTINLLSGLASGGEADGDTLTGIENLQGSSFNDVLTGNNAANTLVGAEGNDTLSGGKGADSLIGSMGNDRLNGGLGNDILNGGAGADVLTGGSGGDLFVFESITDSAPGQADRIADFRQGEDVIDVSGIDAILTLPDMDNEFHFIGNAAFTGASGELRYEITGNTTIIQGETNNWPGVDFQVVLTGAINLTADDFIL